MPESRQAAPLLEHPCIRKSSRTELLNATSVPTLAYPWQIKSLREVFERKPVTCDRKILRRAANKTRRDEIRDEVVRDIVGATHTKK